MRNMAHVLRALKLHTIFVSNVPKCILAPSLAVLFDVIQRCGDTLWVI